MTGSRPDHSSNQCGTAAFYAIISLLSEADMVIALRALICLKAGAVDVARRMKDKMTASGQERLELAMTIYHTARRQGPPEECRYGTQLSTEEANLVYLFRHLTPHQKADYLRKFSRTVDAALSRSLPGDAFAVVDLVADSGARVAPPT